MGEGVFLVSSIDIVTKSVSGGGKKGGTPPNRPCNKTCLCFIFGFSSGAVGLIARLWNSETKRPFLVPPFSLLRVPGRKSKKDRFEVMRAKTLQQGLCT
jgi:hypothetical protein